MSDLGAEITQSDLAAVKSQYKSRIDGAEARRNGVANTIRTGWEMRTVECHLVKDYGVGEVYKVRLDSGEEFGRRTMTDTEKQRGLDFGELQASE